jgi:tripartite-type tricarboxylate transporter receptor subunit TctC
MITRRTTLAAALGAAALPIAAGAQAPAFPQRPVRMVVAFPPGTGPDVMARAIAEAMRPALGQPVVVENRPGAGGNIGAAAVAHSQPDGYTILWGSNGPNALNAFFYPTMPFDPVTAFEPIAIGIISSMVLAVKATTEIGSIQAFVNQARARPGALTVAAIGTTAQVGVEMLRASAGIDVLPVNFQASSQGMTALLRGDVTALFDTLTAVSGGIASRELRVLAVSPNRRVGTLPEVPTFVEAGYDVEVSPWGAVYAPRGTPEAVVAKLNAALNAGLQSPEVQQTVARIGSRAVGGTPADLVALERRDRERFGPVIRRMGITP